MGLKPPRRFSDKHDSTCDFKFSALPPRHSVGSIGWVKQYKCPWALNAPSHATVPPATRNLTPPVHSTTPARAPPGRAEALSCRRSRCGPSLSARTKRPATAEGAEEHSIHVSWRARPAAAKKRQQGQCTQAALGSHAGKQESTATRRSLRTTAACMRAPSSSARTSRPHSCGCLSFAQQPPPKRCSL